MQATRFWMACLPVLVAAIIAGCDDAEDARQPPKPSCADCGGANEGAGGFGGKVFSGGGSSSPAQGGAAAAQSSSGGPGDAGADSGGGQGGAGSGGAAGGEAGAMATGSEQLELCGRLAQGTQNADTVANRYIGAIYTDCRVGWLVVPRGQALKDFVNQLVSFSYNFWGCERTASVNKFGLVLGTPALSQGDVNIVIDHYLAAAQNTLNMSPLERQTMQAALVRLSKPLILDAALEPSKAACPVTMEGAGGVAGSAGAGGAAANSTGGAL